MAQYNNYGASYANAGGYDPYAAAGGAAAGAAYGHQQGGYSDQPGYGEPVGGYSDQDYGNHGYSNGPYDPVHQDNQGYYFDPSQAGNYQDLPSSQQPLSPQQYDDPYGGYQHYDHPGNGSVDNTPMERENPLQVS
jgi:hypothetical protein